MAMVLTIIGAFGTLLWPYAYIGLEPKQSLFIILAGYLGLAFGKIQRWPGILLFSTVCALALTMKSAGLILTPAIAFLLYAQFRDDWRKRPERLLAAAGVIAGICLLGALGASFFWESGGGGLTALLQWTTNSPIRFFMNAIGLFGSPSKGLFIFAPALLLIVYAVPRAYHEHRDIVVYGSLVTACMAAFLSTLVVSADEVWGPRFLHVTVAPLLIVIGAAYGSFQWRRHAPLLVLGATGVAVSFLGAFYYYGARGWAAEATGQNTLEWYSGDPVWNEVHFDAMLFRVWLQGGSDPVYWAPEHRWAWTAPKDAPPVKTVDLRPFADPQSYLLYYWNRPGKEREAVIFPICAVSMVIGPLLLAWVILRTRN
jgi:hypothetical protein